MTSIILQLQQEAFDRSVPVTDLLRKSLVIARKLHLNEFLVWINAELVGYSSGDEIPEYRNVKGTVKFFNPIRGWCPLIFEDPAMGEKLSCRYVCQTIAEIEHLLLSQDSSDKQVPFPPAIESSLNEQLYRDTGLDTKISLIVPNTSLVRIVEQVRDVILNWTLRLEEDGILGEGMTFSGKETQIASEKPQNVNHFYGSVHNPQIQQGNSSPNQVYSQHQFDPNVLTSFVNMLLAKLDELDISEEEVSEIKADADTITSQLASARPKIAILRECGSSIRSILEKAGGSVIGSLLTELAKSAL